MVQEEILQNMLGLRENLKNNAYFFIRVTGYFPDFSSKHGFKNLLPGEILVF